MTLDEFRREMEAYWLAATEEGQEFKDPWISVDRMEALYRKFDAEERQMADRVITEWVLSDDPNFRMLARLLLERFRIFSALPALETLAERVTANPSPKHPSELGIIQELVTALRQSSSRLTAPD